MNEKGTQKRLEGIRETAEALSSFLSIPQLAEFLVSSSLWVSAQLQH